MAAPMFEIHDHWTEADLWDMPDDGRKYEILDGCLHVSPVAGGGHQGIAGELYFVLRGAAPAGSRVLGEINLRVPGGNFEPDLVVLRPGVDHRVTWFESADVALVVEVASPSTRTFDNGSKLLKYAEAGIPSYWRVAVDGTVTVCELDGEEYRTIAVVRPGTRWTATLPFPVEIVPDDLIA